MDLIIRQIYDWSETQELDLEAVKCSSEEILMGMASQAIFEKNTDLWDSGSSVWVFCGRGGNGGDGYALGYLLHQAGYSVLIWEEGEPKKDASRFYRNIAKEAKIPFHSFGDFLRISLGTSSLDIPKKHSVVCVDALLGTGGKGELKKELNTLVTELNKTEIFNFRFSIDSPSGYFPGSKTFFRPDRLHEIGTRKWENLGFALDGKLIPKTYSPIGFDSRRFDDIQRAHAWEPIPLARIKLESERKETGHKYNSGSAVFVGGVTGFSGAIVLAQSAFQGFGGGISKIFSPSEETRNFSLVQDPSRMTQGMEFLETDEFSKKAPVFVVGPGTRNIDFLPNLPDTFFANKWVILDAGGIDAQSHKRFKGAQILLTPHSGEFERLTGKKCLSLWEAKKEAQAFCQKEKLSILYKGFVSFLCLPSGQVFVWEKPNSKLAVMGTGDILAGTLARYLAKGFGLEDSVHFSLSLFDSIAKEGITFPTAWEILEALKGKI